MQRTTSPAAVPPPPLTPAAAMLSTTPVTSADSTTPVPRAGSSDAADQAANPHATTTGIVGSMMMNVEVYPGFTSASGSTSMNTKVLKAAADGGTSVTTGENNFVDPIPFDYGEFTANEIGGRDMLNMAHSVITGPEHHPQHHPHPHQHQYHRQGLGMGGAGLHPGAANNTQQHPQAPVMMRQCNNNQHLMFRQRLPGAEKHLTPDYLPHSLFSGGPHAFPPTSPFHHPHQILNPGVLSHATRLINHHPLAHHHHPSTTSLGHEFVTNAATGGVVSSDSSSSQRSLSQQQQPSSAEGQQQQQQHASLLSQYNHHPSSPMNLNPPGPMTTIPTTTTGSSLLDHIPTAVVPASSSTSTTLQLSNNTPSSSNASQSLNTAAAHAHAHLTTLPSMVSANNNKNNPKAAESSPQQLASGGGLSMSYLNPSPSSSMSTATTSPVVLHHHHHHHHHQSTNTNSREGAHQSQQEATIHLLNELKQKYWRNGRRNLQCFPSCKVFGDYSYIKMEDLKQHDFMWGKCRGSLQVQVGINGAFNFEDLVVLGRVHSLENIPLPFEEAVLNECMIGRIVAPDIMDIMKDQWITGDRIPDGYRGDIYENVGHENSSQNEQNEQNESPAQNHSTHVSIPTKLSNKRFKCSYDFKPKVWKYAEDMTSGKCKRRNVRYYVQFEAFIPILQHETPSFMCVGSGMSSSFEVGSSRVLARQKRKASGAGTKPTTQKRKTPKKTTAEVDSLQVVLGQSLPSSMTALLVENHSNMNLTNKTEEDLSSEEPLVEDDPIAAATTHHHAPTYLDSHNGESQTV